MIIKSAIKELNHPSHLMMRVNHKYPQLFRWMDDEKCLKFWYRITIGKKLNLENPQTFNEKLQWLKLHDRKPIYTQMVDKYEAKKYVSDRIGNEYIIPTLGVWERFDAIDFESLPNQFVLKCTHDSGGLIICKDKSTFDINAAKKRITHSLNRNFYWVGREWPYKYVKPRIIAEAYMEEGDNVELNDYKLMCFNGKVKCSFVCTGRKSQDGLKVTFYDYNWNIMPLERCYPKENKTIDKPSTYHKMLTLAEQLSKDLIFSRVDFYEINGKVYFGEITFFPGAGFEPFSPKEWDEIMGSWIQLP